MATRKRKQKRTPRRRKPQGRTVVVTTHTVRRTTSLGALPLVGAITGAKLLIGAIAGFALWKSRTTGNVPKTLARPDLAPGEVPLSTAVSVNNEIANAVAQGKLPKAIIGPKQQAQLCTTADASFRIIAKIYPIAESVKQAWFQLPCPVKAAYVAGYAVPGFGGPLAVIVAASLQDARVSEAFVKVRTEALKKTGLYKVTRAVAKATNPVFKQASGAVVGASKLVNQSVFGLRGLDDLGH